MDKATRILCSIYLLLSILGILNILSWGGYFNASWFPNTLTLTTLEASAILLNTIVLASHRINTVAKVNHLK
jgi:hypothetical protein